MPGRTPGAPGFSEEPSGFMIITIGANRTQKTAPDSELQAGHRFTPLPMGAWLKLDSPCRRL